MRSRILKSSFFTNDLLAECEPLARLLFQGLWCHADAEGKLEDRPARLKALILPYDDCDVDALLNQLAARNFIVRYQNELNRIIFICKFAEHQNPHPNEKRLGFPDAPGHELKKRGRKPKADKEVASSQLSGKVASDSGVVASDSGKVAADSRAVLENPALHISLSNSLSNSLSLSEGGGKEPEKTADPKPAEPAAAAEKTPLPREEELPSGTPPLREVSLREIDDEPQGLAQQFAFHYAGAAMQHRQIEPLTIFFRELLRQGYSAAALLAHIKDPRRKRDQPPWTFKETFDRGACPSVSPPPPKAPARDPVAEMLRQRRELERLREEAIRSRGGKSVRELMRGAAGEGDRI